MVASGSAIMKPTQHIRDHVTFQDNTKNAAKTGVNMQDERCCNHRFVFWLPAKLLQKTRVQRPSAEANINKPGHYFY